jgi:cell division inhibitor SepF
MAGAWRKAGLYLGLVEDDERRYGDYGSYGDDSDDDYDDEPAPTGRRDRQSERHRETVAATAARTSPTASVGRRGDETRTRGSMALETARPEPLPAYDDLNRITTLHPRTYNEARTIGEHFRDGIPVIMNLTEMDDGDAKRLVDFAAGLSFGLRGSIERITNKVFLLSPEHVEVAAEDKVRMAQHGFFNQS